jgi:hypothetical protein
VKNKSEKRSLLWLVLGILLSMAACNETPAQMQEIRPTIIAASTPTPINVPTNTEIPFPEVTEEPEKQEQITATPTESPTPTLSPTPTRSRARS